MTDNYPNKDGYVADGICVGFCYAEASTITLGSFVKFGTTRADYIGVAITAAAGDAVGMALKAASAAGDIIPVAFLGVVKATVHSTTAIGNLLSNSITTVTSVVPLAYTSDKLLINGGTAHVLGTALQTGAVPGDSILVHLGLKA